MLDIKDTLILFGRSPYINKIRDKIPALIDKYTTMGCNFFCESYPNVDYVIFYDDIAPNVQGSTIVTQAKYFMHDNFQAAKKYPNYPNKELYVVVKNENIFAEKERVLYFYFHTPTMALNWAWRKGFKNVVLVGIDLINNTPHFDKDTTPDIDKPKWFDGDLARARKHIRDVAGRYLKIYQVNPESKIGVKQITIEQLLDNELIENDKERVKNMEKVEIKLLSSVIIDGVIASPEDKSKGIYNVERTVANDLLIRKKAVIFNKKELVKTASTVPPVFDLEELKAIADKLELKYNPNIGAKTLNDKILKDINEKAKDLELGKLNAKEAYELYNANSLNSGSSSGSNEEDITLEELKEIATAAEIDVEDPEDYEKLKELVAISLEQYASELKVEIMPEDSIKEIWAKIQENLKEND